eukprot:superscaffoldBa00000287_g3510
MAVCGRRNRPKLLFILFGVTLVGYLIFLRHSSGDVNDTNRREASGGREVANEQLKKPVYEKPPLDLNALGELGRAVKLNLNGEEKIKEEESIKKHQINTYVSDKVSLHRWLPERWNPLCRELKYDYRSLPTTSVVIAFYNEAWSTLLRTVHSVLEMSPDILLKEVVLVDDYSDRGNRQVGESPRSVETDRLMGRRAGGSTVTKDRNVVRESRKEAHRQVAVTTHLKEPLEKYISGLRKVRLIRATKREGLVRARLLGASITTGDVLTFLDCHCECHEGWLEPLLQRIKEEPSAVVCPVIDVIDWNTFQYLGNSGEPQIGGFDWRLVFTWHAVPSHEQQRRRSPTDVIRSPTMAGGLFAVSKKYFHYLGTYDTGMEVWGGENLEFSFRIWQCGGSLEIHPCSHVGHVFPKKAPYSRSKALANSVRAAEVWMDEYKEVYYHRNPHARLFFEYSMDGEIRYNTREPAGCVVGDNISTYLTVQPCKKRGQPIPVDQKFVLREDGSLYHVMSQKCVEAIDKTDNGTPAPSLQPCSGSLHQKWFFEERT